MAVEMIASANLGILAKNGDTVMKLVQVVYIVGAHALGAESDRRTSKSLPKPRVGAKIALMRPPTLLLLLRPSFQAGTYVAAAAKDAPIICAGRLETRKPRYAYENIRNLAVPKDRLSGGSAMHRIVIQAYVEALGVW